MMQAIANHLWQSTVIAVLIAGLVVVFRHDSARIRYWLWFIASVKFLVPFSLLTAAGRWLGERAGVGIVPEAWSNTVTVVARPFAESSASASPAQLLLVVWLTGSSMLLITMGLRTWQMRRIVATAARDPAPLFIGNKEVAVYRTRERIEPCAIGLLNSSLLLPAELEQRLDTEKLQAVVAHELCHVARRDNLTAGIHMLVETLFWFHPFVWWIGARLIHEREAACDETVVASGHDRVTYAASILDVCEQFVVSPLRSAAGISGSDLRQRITQIMRYQRMNELRLTKKLLLVLAAFAVTAIPTLGGLSSHGFAVAQQPSRAAPTPAAPAAPAPTADRTTPTPNAPAAPAPNAQAAPTATAPATPTLIAQAAPQPATPAEAPPPPVPAPAPEDGEYLPLVKVQPRYPQEALQRRLEGHVVLQYTVNATGSTEDIVAIEYTDPVFEAAAIESARKYKYRPRIINGEPVSVPGVTTMIQFRLSSSDTAPTADAPQ